MFNKFFLYVFFFVLGLSFLLWHSSAFAFCTRVNPSIIFIPTNTVSGAMGDAFDYTIQVTNNDTDDVIVPLCGPINYNLSIVPVAVGLDLESHTLPANTGPIDPAGASVNIPFSVSSKAIGLGLGNYNFNVTAIEGGFSDSAAGIYNITALDVEICSNKDDDDGDDDIDCDDDDCLSDPFCCGNGSVDGAETCDTNLPISCADPTPVCLNDCTGCVAELPGCVIGTGNCDGIAANGCETDLFNDTFNCGSCDNKCKAGYCVGGKCPSLSYAKEGVVPCGRLVDDPSTAWVELQPCTICHIVILFFEAISLLMELVVLVTILAMIVAGLIYIKAGENASLILAAKQNINKVLLGFIIVFIAWIAVNVSMTLFGFNDPLGDGSWKKFDCELGAFVYCGDGIVQNPNDLGEVEECEAGETLNDYAARNSLDPTLDTTKGLWAEDVSRCNSSCKIACKNDPLASKIGEGCFLATNPCQKGRYACDLEGGGVSCLDIYGDPKYASSPWYLEGPLFDYCCESMSSNLSDGFVGPNNDKEISIKRGGPYMALHGLSSFHCEDVCADVGRVCVGVGLTNPATSSCIYVIHDIGASCDLPSNNAATNCSATFSIRNPCDCTSGGKCFGVRETACYCAF